MTGRARREAPARLAGATRGQRTGTVRPSRLAGFVISGALLGFVVLALLAARADAGTAPAPDPAPAAIVCQRGFAWGGECWTKGEGAKFSRWLAAHGASPWAFARRHPDLAATFADGWPGPNWQAMDRSFPKALRYAAGRWGVSYQWLYACAASEGGTNPGHFAIGTHGDSGWFQFLPGTWAWMSNSAFQSRGAPPAAYRHIRSVVGQTYTAAWAFSRGLSYHWYGRGC